VSGGEKQFLDVTPATEELGVIAADLFAFLALLNRPAK